MLDLILKPKKKSDQNLMVPPRHTLQSGFESNNYSYSTAETFGYDKSSFDAWYVDYYFL